MTMPQHVCDGKIHSPKMKENKYDCERFFKKYSQMPRSQKGLEGAGEWHALEKMMPDCCGKRVLDLGCGYGWHCRYAIEHGAVSCTGIDISEKMLHQAQKRNGSLWTNYRCMAIEDFEFEPESFDVVISSLAFHYLESFDDICEKVHRCLTRAAVSSFPSNTRLHCTGFTGMDTDAKRQANSLACRPNTLPKASDVPAFWARKSPNSTRP